MPICYITISREIPYITEQQLKRIRQYVAMGLDSRSRIIDETHIALRVQYGEREFMLGDVEIDIFSQLYLRRLFSRDKRSKAISKNISNYLNCCCATWINMGYVGYSRVSKNGKAYFSDSENPLLHWLQRIRGIATDESE